MARIRTIKPEFPQSESMGRVSRDARLLFVQLWTLCDDAGKARGSSRMLASLLYPYDEDAGSLIGGWLNELESEGCIQRYEVDGNHYVKVLNWPLHQKVDKPSTSKIPEPREASREAAKPRENSSRIKDQGSKDQGPGAEDARAREAPVIARLIPKDWQPTEEDRAWLRMAKPDITDADRKRETEAWHLWCREKGAESRDPSASWRRWMMRAKHDDSAITDPADMDRIIAEALARPA